MKTRETLPPDTGAIAEAVRHLGYDFNTAIADIIDNSIAAEATEIDIICEPGSEDPALLIADNGYGMTEKKLKQSMKYGSTHPGEKRKASDLGRFGLGLKTASFSQCRCLTVISSRGSTLSGAEWDLDLIQKENKWLLSLLDKNEIKKLPYFEHLSETGTVVAWKNLDRFFSGIRSGTKRDDVVCDKLDRAEKHLAMVFHRFLSGEVRGKKKISIRINRHPVEAFDPFCRSHSATRSFPEEIVHIDGKRVRMQAYILPHYRKFTAADYNRYQDRSDFYSSQGGYVYRNGRMISQGGWFRLIPKSEATKLARVQIDFPNSIDQAWIMDIKKSKVTLPYQVQQRRMQIIGRITDGSIQTFKRRGKKLLQKKKFPVWERFPHKGFIWYDLNRKHPLLSLLEKGLSREQKHRLKAYLKAVVASLPVTDIYTEHSVHPKSFKQPERRVDDILKELKDMKRMLCSGLNMSSEDFHDLLLSSEMFSGFDDTLEKFIGEQMHGV